MSVLSRLHRRPTAEPWPRNPRTVADDLRDAQGHEAELSRMLTAARQQADIEAARAAAFEQRAEAAEAEHRKAADELVEAHRKLREVTAERDSLRVATAGLAKQLHDAMGYDDADQYAIATGTGQPRKA